MKKILIIISWFNLSMTVEFTDHQKELSKIPDTMVPKTYSFKSDEYVICKNPQGLFCIEKNYQGDIVKDIVRQGNAWEQYIAEVIKKYSKQGSLVIDIGAHIGTHTMTMSKAVGDQGRVIAFEPQLKVFNELEANLMLNSCTNVLPIRSALGNKEGVVTLAPRIKGNEGGRFIGQGQENIAITRLDNYALSQVSFIKIDVENYESEVLDGAFNTIMQNRPVILIEIQGNYTKAYIDGIDMNIVSKQVIHKLEYELKYRVEPCEGCNYLAFPL